MQHLGQGPVGPSSGYLKWSIWGGWGGWGGWVGFEPVHDSGHVTYRLLAPGTEPRRGPQPTIQAKSREAEHTSLYTPSRGRRIKLE